MFPGDLEMSHRKQTLTVDQWYPSLDKFFEQLELYHNCKVIIGGHPKTQHKQFPNYFGGREVVYGKIQELISQSILVVSRHSTAVSIATIYKKPLLFIYSDELLFNNDQMINLKYISALLGAPLININDSDHYFSHEVDSNLYKQYFYEYLSSCTKGCTNADLLLGIYNECASA